MRPFLGGRVCYRVVSTLKNVVLNRYVLGGVGGRFEMRKTAGAATVSMMPRIKICTGDINLPEVIVHGQLVLTACLGPLVSGAITCAKAPPIGFMMAMTIVAVVLPRTLNHSSLYFVGSTWKTACDKLAKNFQAKHVSFLASGAQNWHVTYLTGNEQCVGFIARERFSGASVPNPGCEN